VIRRSWSALVLWLLRRSRRFRELEAKEAIVRAYFRQPFAGAELQSLEEIQRAVSSLLEQRVPAYVLCDVRVEVEEQAPGWFGVLVRGRRARHG
jgi:hypothetical protein